MFGCLPIEARFRSIGTLRERSSPRCFLMESRIAIASESATLKKANHSLHVEFSIL